MIGWARRHQVAANCRRDGHVRLGKNWKNRLPRQRIHAGDRPICPPGTVVIVKAAVCQSPFPCSSGFLATYPRYAAIVWTSCSQISNNRSRLVRFVEAETGAGMREHFGRGGSVRGAAIRDASAAPHRSGRSAARGVAKHFGSGTACRPGRDVHGLGISVRAGESCRRESEMTIRQEPAVAPTATGGETPQPGTERRHRYPLRGRRRRPAQPSGGAVARAVANQFSLPENVPWSLHDDRGAFLDDEAPIGDQVTTGAKLWVSPKTHLG